MSETITFRRRHLPHWTVADHSYFVTLRLKGSLPRAIVDELANEREALLKLKANQSAMTELQRRQFITVEAILDSAKHGLKYLDIAPVADMVFKAFEWLETKHNWQIHALTIMPNHVHVLLRNTDGKNHLLNQHIGVLKGWTAREANRMLKRKGAFWMDENFDHWCRTAEKVESAAKYIAENPVKSGLANKWDEWPWTRVGRAFLPDRGGNNPCPTRSARNG